MLDLLQTVLPPVFAHDRSRSHMLDCRRAWTSEYCTRSHQPGGQLLDKRTSQGAAQGSGVFAREHRVQPTNVPPRGSQGPQNNGPTLRPTMALCQPGTGRARWAVLFRQLGGLSTYRGGNHRTRTDSDSANVDASTCRPPNASGRICESSDAAFVASYHGRCSGKCLGDPTDSLGTALPNAAAPCCQKLWVSKISEPHRRLPARTTQVLRAPVSNGPRYLHGFDSSSMEPLNAPNRCQVARG